MQKRYKSLRYLSLLTITVLIANTKGIAQQKRSSTPHPELYSGFKTTPDSIQTSVYWYWISGNVSKEGVIKDLQSMKKAGINRAFIGNIGIDDTPYGKVKLFTNEWWDILHTALKTATKLGIDIGIFNSPGWSQSGGPWVNPEQSMRYLTSSSQLVKGPFKFDQKLEKPIDQFQDVRVIAYPAPKGYNSAIISNKPNISSEPSVDNVNNIMDGDEKTTLALPANKPFSVTVVTNTAYTARSLTFYPAHEAMSFEGDVQVLNNGDYQTIKHFKVDRSNKNLNVGFSPFAPAAISIPATTYKGFRIVFSKESKNSAIAELKISALPEVENYIEKTLAKMYQTPLPYWKEYQWEAQPVVNDNDYVVDPEKVIDISKYMAADGTLNWSVPAGNWIIMRSGMTSTKVTNAPAAPEGRGLETDKMSKKHIAEHFNAFLGQIIKRIPAADRKCFKVTVEDSYETGGQNWTDGLIEKFKTVYGYDPTPYIPVMNGKVVGSEDMSDRFLWDMRRFIADEVAYQYVAGLRDVSHQNGLTTWLENYGHWGFPGEFLQYGGQSDEIGGEFWSEGELGNIENRAASSCGHIYGKNKISAESFTCGGAAYSRYPAMMKQRGDRFFTEGINNTLLTVYIEQPYEDKVPGVNAGFSNEFNRKNTWFYDMDMFTAYIKRCNFMLRQGKYVADVAYFIGEDAPKMTGVRDPELPLGYSFDYINGEILNDRATVVNGRLTLPGGMSYKILVLPKLETMRPKLLQKIKLLISQGLVVLGPAPNRSPSLQNYKGADQEVQKLAAELWGNINGTSVKTNKFGKGLIIDGMDMQQALDLVNVIPDCKFSTANHVLFIHRRIKDGEVYFISNQNNIDIDMDAAFRVHDKAPELWDAVTGRARDLSSYQQTAQVTTVPLKLVPYQSAFIVFRKNSTKSMITHEAINYPEQKVITGVAGPWIVTFDTKRWGPAKPQVFDNLIDWTLSTNDSVKYYSGSALYHNTFKGFKAKKGQRIILDLGMVKAMAKVRLNGVAVGGVWTAPYQLDITNAVKAGINTVDIDVVNTWVNRLIGDLGVPKEQRKTWTNVIPYTTNSPLEASGLTGPVSIKTVQY
jgi:hypothetical protein